MVCEGNVNIFFFIQYRVFRLKIPEGRRLVLCPFCTGKYTINMSRMTQRFDVTHIGCVFWCARLRKLGFTIHAWYGKINCTALCRKLKPWTGSAAAGRGEFTHKERNYEKVPGSCTLSGYAGVDVRGVCHDGFGSRPHEGVQL